ncbi:MAG: efflux RND transporter periplasmic adaptor subunit, partial [Muribaculaceae bacterium]|nr:efflux RND transporter periplasmic adaptor subunit [Muribaculaceae bacterium]
SPLLTGTIEPRDEIAIKPQISGIISEIYVEAGQQVKEGDIIAKIKVIAEENQLSSAHNRVSIAENALELQKAKARRTAELYEKKFVSREEYEESQSALRNAEIELASARDALSIVRDGVSSTNAQGSNTLVRSTITGLVLDVPVKVGSSVIQSNTFNDGTTIAKVADMTDLIFKGKVDETEVGLLSIGQPMTITVGALEDVSSDAEIEYISPKAENNNGTNTFEIKAAVRLPDVSALRAGYSANASVVLRRADGVMSVPEAVVEFVGDDAFVYVLTDADKQTFERRQVETGLSDGVNIEITGGITASDKLRGALKQ